MNSTISLPVINRLAGSGAYKSQQMNPPPAEKLGNVVQFELTTGCSYNGCGFCTMYKGQPHKVKDEVQYSSHLNAVWNALGEQPDGREVIRGLERVFIGGGNALAVEPKLLNWAIQETAESFRQNVGRLPKRIALYGNTRDILKYGKRNLFSSRNDLSTINCGGSCLNGCSEDRFGKKVGLNLIYWGIESGSTEVLEYANKGYEEEDIAIANEVIRGSGVEVSAMIINGLGGTRLSWPHVRDTIEVLNLVRPRFVTFIGIDAGPETPYAKKIADEMKAGTNRPLDVSEQFKQMVSIIERLEFSTDIGCHGSNVHSFGFNAIPFGSIEYRLGYKDCMSPLHKIIESIDANR